MPSGSFAKFVRDKANLDVLFAGIWEALGEVIGNDELEKISKLLENSPEEYDDYVVHYIDKCNVEYLKTAVEKRKDKIISIHPKESIKNITFTTIQKLWRRITEYTGRNQIILIYLQLERLTD